MGPRTGVQVAQDSWSTPRSLRHKRVSPGTFGGARGPSNPGLSGQRQQVDLAGPRTGAQVARDCWSTLRALRTR